MMVPLQGAGTAFGFSLHCCARLAAVSGFLLKRKATRVPDRSPLQELPRITLGVFSIGVLIAASVWVLWPFTAVLVWATTIVVATWPLLLVVQGWLGGRRGLAVAAMILALLALLVIPVWLAVSTI